MKSIIALTNKVLDINTMPTTQKKSEVRFKLELTDGQETMFGLLPNDKKSMIETKEIRQFTLIRLNQVTVNTIDKKQ